MQEFILLDSEPDQETNNLYSLRHKKERDMKKTVAILAVVFLVLSTTAFAKGGRDYLPDNAGPIAGPKSEGLGKSAFGRGHNPNTEFGPKHGHSIPDSEPEDPDPRGAPNSGDGVPDGSGWDEDEVPCIDFTR